MRCGTCGLRWYSPLPSEEELRRLYARPDYLSADYFAQEHEDRSPHFRRMVRAADLLAERLGERGRILEIGPGQGPFLGLCRDRGLTFDAIELSAPLAGALRKRFGCLVLKESFEACTLPANCYDALVAFDLLEHVRDPLVWLQEAQRVLTPGGTLIFSTVNVDNLLDLVGRLLLSLGFSGPIAKLHPPYHLFYFTRSILERYLAQVGLEIEDIGHENYSPEKAGASLVEKIVMKAIYLMHDITGKRTNFYITCRKPLLDAGDTSVNDGMARPLDLTVS